MIRYQPRFAPALRSLAAALRQQAYELVLAECLGADPFRALHLKSAEELALSDRINEQLPGPRGLFHLALLEEPVPPAQLEPYLSSGVLSDLVDLGLLVEDQGRLRTDFYRLIPFEGCLFVAHPLLYRSDTGIRPPPRIPSVYLGLDSAELCQSIRAGGMPPAGSSVLDLCAGTGFVGIWLAAAAACHVVATEIDPEAIEVARANVSMNGLDGLVAVEAGDLFSSIADRRFDLIAANPPYLPCPADVGYPLWGDGGPDGLRLIARILDESRRHLSEDGVLSLVARAYGDEREPGLGALLANHCGPRTRGSPDSLLLSQRRVLDRAAARRLAAAALHDGSVVEDAGLDAMAARFHTHFLAQGLTHEYWAVMRLHGRRQGFCLKRLYDWLGPSDVMALQSGLQLVPASSGLFRLVESDGQEMTVVPGRDAAFLALLDGTRSIGAVQRLSGLNIRQAMELARLYFRAGALDVIDDQ